ncbi:hypothetical protein Taro_035681 [Colocasia esculenta]|uniref:Retrotransposon gag domain-containing protein n=1 Tax=Colocasia esculenta TaxID=4460 RepID=A0A843WDX8_COLES|nr:hypothetical protein [Colocasia esculenta]
MKGVRNPKHDFDVDPSTTHMGLCARLGVCASLNRGTSFRTCCGRVEELLVAGELWIDHKKLIFFPLFVCFNLCKPSSWSRPKAGNQAAAAARNGAGDLHRNFRSLNPARLSTSPDPDESENWQEEIERIFQVMQCTNREKVVLATFQFTKDAQAWWKAPSAHLPNVGELEWAGFLEIFQGK